MSEEFGGVWKCECENCICTTQNECLLSCASNNACDCCGVYVTSSFTDIFPSSSYLES